MVLLTDGEDLEKSGVQTAQSLAEKGVMIFTGGRRHPAGSPIRLVNELEFPSSCGTRPERRAKATLTKPRSPQLRRRRMRGYQPLGTLARAWKRCAGRWRTRAGRQPAKSAIAVSVVSSRWLCTTFPAWSRKNSETPSSFTSRMGLPAAVPTPTVKIMTPFLPATARLDAGLLQILPVGEQHHDLAAIVLFHRPIGFIQGASRCPCPARACLLASTASRASRKRVIIKRQRTLQKRLAREGHQAHAPAPVPLHEIQDRILGAGQAVRLHVGRQHAAGNNPG